MLNMMPSTIGQDIILATHSFKLRRATESHYKSEINSPGFSPPNNGDGEVKPPELTNHLGNLSSRRDQVEM